MITRRQALEGLLAAGLPFVPSEFVMSKRPAFIEQHSTGFFGRGMLAAETNHVVTEQVCSGACGDQSVSCTDATHFLVRGTVCVKHDDGTYGTHVVASKTGDVINVLPPLRRAATHIERLWYDRAHPGKHYIRHLAQRIANATEVSAAMPDGKWIMRPDFQSGTPLVAYGGSVSYFDAGNIGDGDGAPVRFGPGRTAYLSGFTVDNQGAETAAYPNNGVSRAIVRVLLSTNGNCQRTRIRVMNQHGHMIASHLIQGGAAQRVQQWYSFPADLRGASTVKVQILALDNAVNTWVAVSAIHVFEAPKETGFVIPRDAKVVCLGDSWTTGDLPRLDGNGNTIGTLEREPLTACLAAALPNATIIGAGRGGDLLLGDPNYPGSGFVSRFDTEVAPHNPDVVVIVNGANDGFHPPVTGAWLAGWNILLGKCAAIGTRPVIVGVPALCEEETQGPGWYNYAPNNSVKTLAAAFQNFY